MVKIFKDIDVDDSNAINREELKAAIVGHLRQDPPSQPLIDGKLLLITNSDCGGGCGSDGDGGGSVGGVDTSSMSDSTAAADTRDSGPVALSNADSLPTERDSNSRAKEYSERAVEVEDSQKEVEHSQKEVEYSQKEVEHNHDEAEDSRRVSDDREENVVVDEGTEAVSEVGLPPQPAGEEVDVDTAAVQVIQTVWRDYAAKLLMQHKERKAMYVLS